jgi:hypothetical protein
LVFDRARLLLRYLGFQQIADKALGFVLALERGGECFVISAPHPEKFEFTHQVEDFGSFRDHALLS